MQYPFCSVIVLNFEGEKIIRRTIDSLLLLDYPKDRYEILVVDNGSKDKSREIIEKYCHCEESALGGDKANPMGSPRFARDDKKPIITAIFLPENLGFAGGNNVGIKRAKGDYVALLNNDCTVEKSWLKELVHAAQAKSDIFAVNSKVMLGDTNKIQNAGIRIFPNGYARDIGAIPHDKKQDYEEDTGQYETVREVDAACAAAVLYRKSALDRIGLLDESFFLYYEDVELSERARKHGYKIIYSPKAIVHHLHAASSAEWSPFFIYHSERGRLMHVLLHFPLSVFLKEYFLFTAKAKARFLIRLFTKPSSVRVNWQYIRVSWFFLIHPELLFSTNRSI